MTRAKRTVQNQTANALPTGTAPLVDGTAEGDVQYVKIMSGEVGSVEEITGTAADGLLVEVSNFSKVSTLNSSTAPLGPNESFIGEWEDASEYAEIAVDCYVEGATMFLKVDYSSDGINIDLPGTFVYVAAQWKLYPVLAKYYRITAFWSAD